MKVDVSKESPSYAKFGRFFCTLSPPPTINGQNPLSWPETSFRLSLKIKEQCWE